MVLDIGGGNTKGGYIDVRNNDTFVFFPLSVNYGTITLTEAINKKTKKDDISEYNEKAFGFLPTLRKQVDAMYGSSPVALEKEKANWLVQMLEKVSIENDQKLTFNHLKSDFETHFEDFELFWYSKPVNTLREFGLLIL